MIDLKNASIANITLQKVGNKIREEKNIFAKSLLELGERKKEDLTSFLLNPFRKQLEKHHFVDYTGQLEFNTLYNFTSSLFNENLHKANSFFLEYSKVVLNHLYDKSDHPQIKPGEVFVVEFKDVLYESINTSAIGIYKLENKRKLLCFDESETIDLSIFKGYKLEGIDKAALIISSFEVSPTALKEQKRRVKGDIKLDTDIEIKLNINKPEASEDYLERCYDDEKKMFYYKVYFNSEK